MDIIAAMNLVFCILIVILGYAGYRQSRRISKVLYRLPLLIGTAFGLFGISHFVTVIGMGGALADALVVVRALGYIVVIASDGMGNRRLKEIVPPACRHKPGGALGLPRRELCAGPQEEEGAQAGH